MIERYFQKITELLEEIRTSQADQIEQAAAMIANATSSGHTFFAFGCSHSGLLVQDIYYRAGTFMLVHPLFGPGMSLSHDFPPTKTSAMERLSGLAKVILDASPATDGDILLLVSTSGRNRVPVEMAREAKCRGLKVIALTSMAYSSAVSSHDASGAHVNDLADLVLNNMAPVGDAAFVMDRLPAPIGPVSSVTGTAILHAMMSRVVEKWLEMGLTPPVYMSGNLDGGSDFNQKMFEKYRESLPFRP